MGRSSKEDNAKYLAALEPRSFLEKYVGIVKDGRRFTRFMGSLVLFLKENMLDGIAIVELRVTVDDLDLVGQALEEIRRYTKPFGYRLLLGLTIENHGIAIAAPGLLMTIRSEYRF